MRKVGSSFLALMLVVFVAAPAYAAWTSPLVLSNAPTGTFENQLMVAMDADGDSVFVWAGWSDGPGPDRIEARSRSAAGALSTVKTLSTPGETVITPRVAMNASGDAVFAWSAWDESALAYRLQGRTLSAAGDWGPLLRRVSNPAPNQDAFQPGVAIDADGDAIFTWRRHDGTSFRIQARALSSAGFLGAIQNISPAGQHAGGGDLAMDTEGDAVFTWKTGVEGVPETRLRARTRSAAGALGPVLNLSSPTSFPATGTPQVAIDADGDAVFVWERHDGALWRIQARALSVSGVLSPVQGLSRAGYNAEESQVAMAPDGDAILTWHLFDGSYYRVQARTRSATGVVSPVETLSGAGLHALDPQVAVETDGDAIWSWRFADGSENRVQVRTRSASGVHGTVQTLTPTGQDAVYSSIAVSADGLYAAVAYLGTDSSGHRARAAFGP